MRDSSSKHSEQVRYVGNLVATAPLGFGDEIVPAVILDNDRPEWQLIGGELLMAVMGGQAAVVGQLSYVGIANPRNSGVIGVVTEIDVSTEANPVGFRMVTGTQFDTLFAASVAASLVLRDGRLDQIGAGVATPLRFISGAAAAPGGLQFNVVAANTDPPRKSPIILGPGSAIIEVGQTVNTALTGVNWFARSRPLEGRAPRRGTT